MKDVIHIMVIYGIRRRSLRMPYELIPFDNKKLYKGCYSYCGNLWGIAQLRWAIPHMN